MQATRGGLRTFPIWVLCALLAIVLCCPSNLGASDRTSERCEGDAYELARRFTGRWQEFTLLEEGEELVGTLTVRLEAGECALTQSFESVDGGFTFESMGYVDSDTGAWHEVFVLSTGRVAHYRWRLDGGDVIMDHVEGAPGTRRRLRATHLGEDSYLVLEEHSLDEGATWQIVERTATRRVRP